MGVLLPRLLMLQSILCAGFFTLPQLALSAPVYQWQDASGQTVYSDQPPPAGTPVEQLQFPAPPSAADVEAAEQRSKAMQQQVEQLAEARRQRERRAAEIAQKAAQEATPAQPEELEEPSQNSYYDPQTYYPDRQPIFRPRPPYGDIPARPTHPIARPGLPRR